MPSRVISGPGTSKPRFLRYGIFLFALLCLLPLAPGARGQDAIPAPPPPQQPGQQKGVIKANVDLVVLHATVMDQKQRLVSGLRQNDFTVFEDGRPMAITSFHQEDIPVAIGIVIDNSGSMRDKRQKVNQAAINLVRASNPQDELFVVNFNDEYYLDQDFTSDINRLREGLLPG